MDIRTWQEADRPVPPDPGFDDDPAFPDAAGAGHPHPAHPPFGAAGAGPGPGPGKAFAAADVISLGPADRAGRPGRSRYSAQHRSGRSPFSPLRPAPIAIGSLSTAAIAAFAFVGPGILHGGDAASTSPILDGTPHRIAPLTPGSDASSAAVTTSGPSSAAGPATPTATSTASGSATGPTSAAPTRGGHTGATPPSTPSGSGPSGTAGPTAPGTPAPPSGDPSGPPSTPPTAPPTTPPTEQPPVQGPITPPGTPTPPPAPPTTTPAPIAFNASAAVSTALTEIGAARDTYGADALSVDQALVRAAAKHNGDMVRTGRFSHIGSDGSSPFTRAQSQGCWTLSKELIARGRPGDDVVGALLKDPQSRPALLSYMNASIGMSAQQDPKTGDVYWTIELAWL